MKIKIKVVSLCLTLFFSVNFAKAEQLDTNMAQMQAMDKITGRVSIIDVPVNGEVKFGTFSIVVRSCKTNPEGEVPENYAFIDVSDKSFDKEEFNIFKGWMLSSSPAVNAVEHPIYDVWLIKCYNSNDKINVLTKEELAKRDELPRLQEIKQLAVNEKSHPYEEKEVVNITFKDSMYEDEKLLKQDVIKNEVAQDDNKPHNLLNIEANFDVYEEQVVSIPADEFSDALNNESRNLYNNDVFIADDELSAAIDAELAKHK